MTNYAEYLQRAKQQKTQDQLRCQHEFWDDRIYMKCKKCGMLHAFRSEEDFKRRGEMGLPDDSDVE